MSKNTRNRILLTAVAALLLVTLTIGGTIAWLTDATEEVKNTFTASTIGIDINEHNGEEVVKANTYKMVPGAVLAKDPYVTIEKGSEATYVFVEITKSATYDSYMENYVVDTDRWTKLSEDGLVAVYYTTQAATTDAVDIDILDPETVTVKTTVTKGMMDDLIAGKVAEPTLTFKAYAIQQANGDATFTADEAWDLLNAE